MKSENCCTLSFLFLFLISCQKDLFLQNFFTALKLHVNFLQKLHQKYFNQFQSVWKQISMCNLLEHVTEPAEDMNDCQLWLGSPESFRGLNLGSYSLFTNRMISVPSVMCIQNQEAKNNSELHTESIQVTNHRKESHSKAEIKGLPNKDKGETVPFQIYVATLSA